MRRIVFYSWQSDLPNATNRGLIESALEIAARAISGDSEIDVEPVIDRDTEGVAGSPDIASTIFAKIDAADIVVADVSIISSDGTGRPTPNPNVMIEVGYALRSLKFERVILVFNAAFGKIDKLPFDLRMRRLVVYTAAQEESDRAAPRKELAQRLELALRAALPLIPSPDGSPVANPAVEAVENQKPNRRVAVRAELAAILKALDAAQPTITSKGGTTEEFLRALSATQPTIARFSRLAEVVAVMNDEDMATELFVWFGQVLERYSHPRGFSGAFNDADFDFFRFLGHELFVTLFAFLVREQSWNVVSRILNEPIPVKYLRRDDGPGNAEWWDVCRHVRILGGESQRRERLSYHGDLLRERHSTGELAAILPFDEFSDADFFLYLRSLLPDEEFTGNFHWRPWSALWLQGTPRFLLRARSVTQADAVRMALALPSVGEFKRRLQERGAQVAVLYRGGFWDYPVRSDDVERIATR